MKIHTIQLQPTRYAEDEGTKFDSPNVYSCKSRHQGGRVTRFKIGYVSPDGECRREYQGPILPGPYAYSYALGTCIAANPAMSTGAEIERNKAAGLEFDAEVGDLFEIGGFIWELREDRALHDPELHLVSPTDLVRIMADSEARVAAAEARVADATAEVAAAEARLAAHTK